MVGGGYINGVKTLPNKDNIKSLLGTLEDSSNLKVLKYDSFSSKISKTGFKKLKLSKRNANTFISKKKINYQKYSKKSVFFIYDGKKIHRSIDYSIKNPQKFITTD